MLIKTLVENTSISKDFGSEHGLSLYIETKKHKILFDVGASELFLQNAKKLDVSIADVDFLVISHGHYDHGGGLKSFLHENTKAEVFLHRLAFEKHYAIRPNDEMIDRIGKYLMSTKAKFYTCHCTGVEPYKSLKAIMGDSIDYLSAGSEIVI